MSSAKALTGGSLDVNPQYLGTTVAADDANPNGFFVKRIDLPVPIIPQSKRATIIELLECEFHCVEPEWSPVASTAQATYLRAEGFLLYRSTTARPQAGDAVVIANVGYHDRIMQSTSMLSSVSAQSGPAHKWPLTIDFTDGAGHGILIGTNLIFCAAYFAGYQAPSLDPGNPNLSVKLKYRFKTVSIEEYVGIVTAQQPSQ